MFKRLDTKNAHGHLCELAFHYTSGTRGRWGYGSVSPIEAQSPTEFSAAGDDHGALWAILETGEEWEAVRAVSCRVGVLLAQGGDGKAFVGLSDPQLVYQVEVGISGPADSRS
jgi:hypothetical protein